MIKLLKQNLALIFGIALSFSVFFLTYFYSKDKNLSISLSIAVLMFSCWISESLPMGITALIPICLLPLFNIMTIEEVTKFYSHKVIYLMFSGFLLGIILQKWNLNYRIALNILRCTGNHPIGIILGFMLSTAFVSMWISNTAATIIMLPIAISFLTISKNVNEKFAMVLILSIAYSANIGGLATIIGTPTNAVLVSLLDELYHVKISFSWWFIRFFPVALILIITFWIYLGVFYLRKLRLQKSFEQNFIQNKLQELGKFTYEETIVLIIFLLLVLTWIFQSYLPFKILDSVVGLIFVTLFFIIPSKKENQKLLEWKDTKDMPWDALLAIGGVLALASSLEKTGVIDLISQGFVALEINSYLIALIVITLGTIFLTEFMNNTALVTVIAPIVMVLSLHFSDSPSALSIPATIAASCGFMMPMGTPPNMIVFSTGYIKIQEMMKVGLFANLIAAIVIIFYSYLIF